MFPHQLLLLLTTLFIYTANNAWCQVLIDVSKEVCCDGTVQAQPLNETTGYRCCGSQLLLTHIGVCCGDTIVPYTQNVTGEYYNWGCCKSPGGQVNLYNVRTQRCCQGNVIDVGDNFSIACCGNTTYDSRKAVCCDNVIHTMDHRGEMGCCGDQLFNFTTHLCCSQWPDNKVDTDDLINRKPQFKLQPLPDEMEMKFQQRCCGLDLYNFDSEVCCDDTLHKRPINSSLYGSGCCGSKLITNPEKEICCLGGVVRARQSHDQLCCGDGLFNEEHEMCCKGQVTPRTPNTSCCYDAGKVYDRMTHRCCGDQLTPLPTNHTNTLDAIQCCSKRPKHTFLTIEPVG